MIKKITISCLSLMFSVNILASSITVKARGVNPLKIAKVAQLVAPLPSGVQEKDIIKVVLDRDGSASVLNNKDYVLGFSESGRELNYILTIQPKGMATIAVTINDIWVIDKALIEKSKLNLENLIKSSQSPTALNLAKQALTSINSLEKQQKKSSLDVVSPQKHIDAFVGIQKTFEQVNRNILIIKKLNREYK